MFKKVIDVMVKIAINGFLALIITMLLSLVLGFLFYCCMIPVSIIAGESTANWLLKLAGNKMVDTIIYTIVFVSMTMEDFGIPGIKTAFKRWRKRTSKKVSA